MKKDYLSLEEYLNLINEDSEQYYEFTHECILKIEAKDCPLDLVKLFDNDNKVFKFEIGFGNGVSLIELAKQNPDINYFGIDRKMDRVRTALSKLTKENLPNLLIARADTSFMTQIFEKGFFDEIIMNFPDPWPKKKKKKHRTVNEKFLSDIHILLKDNGVFRFASDHEEYSQVVIDLFEKSDLFENLYAPELCKHQIENRIMTQFEIHKIKQGFKIHYMKYRKK